MCPALVKNSLTYDDVSQWKPGRTVNIAYAVETGTVLLDPASGQYCEIITGLKEHPLDLLHQGKMGEGSRPRWWSGRLR